MRQRIPAAAGASPTAWPWRRSLRRSLAIAVAAALFMSFVGAFGTDAAPLVRRLAYWICTMSLAGMIGAGVFQPAFSRGWLERRPILTCLVLASLMAVPQTALIWVTTRLFFPQQMLMDPRVLPRLYPLVLLVAVVVTAVNYLAATRAEKPVETHATPPGAAPPRFLERLPARLRGGELYAIQAEDHYLRLHTSRGSDLILLRLADAVAELEGIEGAQTHRSWWVAKAAVTDARRADGRAVLTLKNGVQAPVSRSYAAALRAAGWF